MSYIPSEINSITVDWLSNILKKTYPTHSTRLINIKTKSLGPGVGYVGQLFRCTLFYDHFDKDMPTSLIAKFSSKDPKIRNPFHKSGIYEVEVRFYKELAKKININIPRSYFSEINMITGHSLILLEDLDRYKTKNFDVGCTLEESLLVITQFAKFHAEWWNNQKLKKIKYLKPHDYMGIYWQTQFQEWWSKLKQDLQTLLPDYRIPPHFLHLGNQFAPNVSRLFSRMSEKPLTLIHKDSHLNNIMFSIDDQTKSIMLLDWQMVGYGKGVSDITHFIVSSLPVKLRRSHENFLTKAYHEELLANGVIDYTYNQCWTDYLLSFFKNIYITVLLVGFLDASSLQGKRLLKTLLPRVTTFCDDHYKELKKFIEL